MCTRAHTANRSPASVSTAPTQKGQAAAGMKRSPSAWTGEYCGKSRNTASMSGAMCRTRDRIGSCRAVVLTLNDATHQYPAQLSHMAWNRYRDANVMESLLARAASCADGPDLLQRLFGHDVIGVVQVHCRIAVRHGEPHDVAYRPRVLLRRIDDQAMLIAHENEVRSLRCAGQY